MNERPLYHLDLFSGIAGFALAAQWANALADTKSRGCCESGKCGSMAGVGARRQDNTMPTSQSNPRIITIAHAEVEPFACAVYHRHFPQSVCFGGVQNITRDSILERTGVEQVDLVTGGFPCQPHSLAGKRLASADDRDLWGECARIVGDLRPRYALFENVAGLLTSESGRFFNRVLSDLAALRYDVLWQVIPAAAVGAPHRRERVWIVAMANGDERGGKQDRVTKIGRAHV